jgi:hypothetical protein
MSESNAPMKMKLMHLVIETNRQCNLNCTHCMRGDAQDLTITPEIIDKLLDQVEFIMELDLTGGEPFLHPEIIEYLFDGIIKRDIFLLGAGCVTNGTICDQRVADAFSKLAKYVNEKMQSAKRNEPKLPGKGLVGIGISTDPFHQVSPLYLPEATYQFYKRHCSPETDISYQSLSELGSGKVNGRLTYAGRAKNLPIDPEYPFRVDSSFHRFAMGDIGSGGFSCPHHSENPVDTWFNVPYAVMCEVEITAKGGFQMGGMKSFDEEDEQAQDNILTCSLYDCIWNWNHRYPILCQEAEQYYREPRNIIVSKGNTHPIYKEIREAGKELPEVGRINETYSQKCLLAFDDLIWVRQQLESRYKNRFLPFNILWEATQDTFKDALELPAHDLDNRWKLLRKASKELKELLIVHKIDTDCPDLNYDDTDYDNTTDEDGLGDMAMMELLEKY